MYLATFGASQCIEIAYGAPADSEETAYNLFSTTKREYLTLLLRTIKPWIAEKRKEFPEHDKLIKGIYDRLKWMYLTPLFFDHRLGPSVPYHAPLLSEGWIHDIMNMFKSLGDHLGQVSVSHTYLPPRRHLSKKMHILLRLLPGLSHLLLVPGQLVSLRSS